MKENKIKMIAFDLDGTLLTDDKQVTEYTKEVLKKAADRGIEIVPATGRPYTALPEEVRALPGVRYAVTSNGARLVRLETKETLAAHLLPLDKARKIMDIFKEYDVIRDIFYDGQGYIESGKMPHIERYVRTPAMIRYVQKERIGVEDIDGMLEREGRDVDKVQALFAVPSEKEEAYRRIRLIGGVEATGALENNIEVNASGVHKGIALAELGEWLGILPAETIAFGDGTNDSKMLKSAGVGVAMGNAAEEVKEAADAVTLSNEENGVAAYIEKYVLV